MSIFLLQWTGEQPAEHSREPRLSLVLIRQFGLSPSVSSPNNVFRSPGVSSAGCSVTDDHIGYTDPRPERMVMGAA